VFSVLPNLPHGQVVHADSPPALMVPSVQAVHVVDWAASANWPAMQSLQMDVPARRPYLPTGQSVHTSDPW